MKPLLSLRDIAREAGVHYTTVSLALRNDLRLPLETRERIQELAKRLGYNRNPLVSNLISNLKRARLPAELGVIGFLDTQSRPSGPYRSSPVGHPFYEGALRRAGELGYQMEVFQIHSTGMTSRRMSSILKTRGIRGLIIDSHMFPRGHLSMDVSQFSCVMRGYSNLRPNLHRVCHNHFQGILCAVHSLRHFGYRRMGLVLHESTDKLVNNQWIAGFLTYQRQLPASARVPLLVERDISPQKMRRWIERHRPEVVLGLPGTHALLAGAGADAPGEIGFANLDLDSSLDKGQAGIWQSMDSIGSTAVEFLTAQMQRGERGVPDQPKLTMVEGKWRNGTSIRPLRDEVN
jgi:LacI family transcriptional regulator